MALAATLIVPRIRPYNAMAPSLIVPRTGPHNAMEPSLIVPCIRPHNHFTVLYLDLHRSCASFWQQRKVHSGTAGRLGVSPVLSLEHHGTAFLEIP